jgi:hypothetical protein
MPVGLPHVRAKSYLAPIRYHAAGRGECVDVRIAAAEDHGGHGRALI